MPGREGTPILRFLRTYRFAIERSEKDVVITNPYLKNIYRYVEAAKLLLGEDVGAYVDHGRRYLQIEAKIYSVGPGTMHRGRE